MTEIAEGTAAELTALQGAMAEPIDSVAGNMEVEPVREATLTDLGEQRDALAAGVTVTSAPPVATQVTSSEIPAKSVKKPAKKIADCKTVQSSSTLMTAAPVITSSVKKTAKSDAIPESKTAASLVATSAINSATSTATVR